MKLSRFFLIPVSVPVVFYKFYWRENRFGQAPRRMWPAEGEVSRLNASMWAAWEFLSAASAAPSGAH
jgi:hypothetical protein